MMNVSERSVTDFESFQIPIGICLKAFPQFVLELIFGYVCSFFFKFLIFCIVFRLYFRNLQYFLSQYYY